MKRRRFAYQPKGTAKARGLVITPLGRRILRRLDAGTYRTRRAGPTPNLAGRRLRGIAKGGA